MLTQAGVATAITHLNEQLMTANLEDRYVTLSAAVIDPKTHRIELVSAGHLSPWVYRQGDEEAAEGVRERHGRLPGRLGARSRVHGLPGRVGAGR